jgi:chromosomal replication initiation ATPase DnaA
MSQLRLPLGLPAGGREAGFIVSDSNALVVHQLEHWGAWPVMAALLVGPPQSGRSLLAHIFAEKTAGTVIDDAEGADETDIFHAWNAAQRERHPLLIVAHEPPPLWEITLPDLRSRLAATPVLRIEPPDDALLELLAARELDGRELLYKPDLVAWLARRIERSHSALFRVLDELEADAVRRDSRRLSIPAARATLAEAGLLVEPPVDPLSERS